MAVSVRQHWLAVLWGVLMIGLTVAGAEVGWYVVRQEVLLRFEAVCNCHARAINVPPETLVHRPRAMHHAGRMGIDLFA